MNAPKPKELLSQRETFPGSWVERWEKGAAANRRIRQLRSAFGQSVATRTVVDTFKLWSAPGADRKHVAVTEILYIAHRGAIPTFLEDRDPKPANVIRRLPRPAFA